MMIPLFLGGINLWVPLIITNNFCINFVCQKCQEGLDLDSPISPKAPFTPKIKVIETMTIWVFRQAQMSGKLPEACFQVSAMLRLVSRSNEAIANSSY